MLIPGGPVIHYDDLDAASARIAHALVDAGCRVGDRVAVQTEKCPQSLALYLACLRAGLVYLPLNSGYQKGELALLLRRCRANRHRLPPRRRRRRRGAATGGDRTHARPRGAARCSSARENQADTFETMVSKADDLAAILYTSGTTGRSKGAMLSHRNLASNALTLVEQWGFTRGDVLLHALPVYHVHGLFVACHCALLSGSRILWLPEVRCRRGMRAVAAGNCDDGRADVLHPLVGRADIRRGGMPWHPAVRVRLRPAAARDVQRLSRSHGARDPRALRHDRDRYEHRQTRSPATGLPARWGRRCPASRCASSMRTGVPARPVRSAASRSRVRMSFAGTGACPSKRATAFSADGYFRTGDMGEWLPNGYVKLVGRANGPHHQRRA